MASPSTSKEDPNKLKNDKIKKPKFKWSKEVEMNLLYSMVGIKPTGINKHVSVFLIQRNMMQNYNINIPTKVIWKYLHSKWNLEAADKVDDDSSDSSTNTLDLPDEYKKKCERHDNNTIEVVSDDSSISSLNFSEEFDEEFEDSIDEEFDDSMDEEFEGSIDKELEDSMNEEFEDSMDEEFEDSVDEELEDSMDEEIEDSTDGEVEDPIDDLIENIYTDDNTVINSFTLPKEFNEALLEEERKLEALKGNSMLSEDFKVSISLPNNTPAETSKIGSEDVGENSLGSIDKDLVQSNEKCFYKNEDGGIKKKINHVFESSFIPGSSQQLEDRIRNISDISSIPVTSGVISKTTNMCLKDEDKVIIEGACAKYGNLKVLLPKVNIESFEVDPKEDDATESKNPVRKVNDFKNKIKVMRRGRVSSNYLVIKQHSDNEQLRKGTDNK